MVLSDQTATACSGKVGDLGRAGRRVGRQRVCIQPTQTIVDTADQVAARLVYVYGLGVAKAVGGYGRACVLGAAAGVAMWLPVGIEGTVQGEGLESAKRFFWPWRCC